MQHCRQSSDGPLFKKTGSYQKALHEAKFYLTQIQARPVNISGILAANQVKNNTNQPLVTVTAGGCPGKQINATNFQDAKIQVYDTNPFEPKNNSHLNISTTGESPVNLEDISESLSTIAFRIEM